MKDTSKKVITRIGKGVISTVLALAIGAGGTAGYFFYSKNADMTIRLNENKKHQTFDGWGSAACWWAQKTPDEETRNEIARLLYSKEGLGLNIYRYNVGGGYDPDKERVENPWRRTESFYYYNKENGRWEYDFTRDANAQAMLDAALSYGCIDTVVLFANSPHYSMTVSGMASGGTEAYTSNLREDAYEAFVDYFLTITEYFLDKGVPVKMISPINEPQWSWGGDWVGQEGCHYEEDEALRLLHLFAEEIEKRNLPVTLCAPESGNIGDTTKRYFENMLADETIRSKLGTLAYHSYFSDDDRTAKAKLGAWIEKNAEGVPVAMSEWCELPCINDTTSVQAALRMARVICQDLTCSVRLDRLGGGEPARREAPRRRRGFFGRDDFRRRRFQRILHHHALPCYGAFFQIHSRRQRAHRRELCNLSAGHHQNRRRQDDVLHLGQLRRVPDPGQQHGAGGGQRGRRAEFEPAHRQNPNDRNTNRRHPAGGSGL